MKKNNGISLTESNGKNDKKKKYNKPVIKEIAKKNQKKKKEETPKFTLYPGAFPVKITKDCEIKLKNKENKKLVKRFLKDLNTLDAMREKFGDNTEALDHVIKCKKGYYLSFLHGYNAAVISHDMQAGLAIANVLACYEDLHKELVNYMEKEEKERKERLLKAITVEQDIMSDPIIRPTVSVDEIPPYSMFIYNGNVFYKYGSVATSHLVSPLKETGEEDRMLTFKTYLVKYCNFDPLYQDICEVQVSPYKPEFSVKLEDDIEGFKWGNGVCKPDDDEDDDFEPKPSMISEELKEKLLDDLDEEDE